MLSPVPIVFRRTPCVLLTCLLAMAGVTFAQSDGEKTPERWEKAIAAFERQDVEDPPPRDGVLFVGSSSIRLWDLSQSFPELEAINRGFGGSEISDAVHFADRIILKHQPRVVVLYAGDNDIAGGKTPRRVQADFHRFVRTVHATLPSARIVFLSIKPSLKRRSLVNEMREANRLICCDCRCDSRLEFVDVFSPMLGADGQPRPDLFVKDGLHLSEAGYRLWAEILEPHLR